MWREKSRAVIARRDSCEGSVVAESTEALTYALEMSDPRLRIPITPPNKYAEPSAENVARLAAWLDAITAYGPHTEGRPWTFYEELESYLGPSGPDGYLLEYGKKYCRLFYDNRRLRKSAVARRWVRRTLLLLQHELKRFVLSRFLSCQLATLTLDELKQAAFASHPQAYSWGGLTTVGLRSPGLVLEIALIPGAEFNPRSRNFGATIRQVGITLRIALSESVARLWSASALSMQAARSLQRPTPATARRPR